MDALKYSQSHSYLLGGKHYKIREDLKALDIYLKK